VSVKINIPESVNPPGTELTVSYNGDVHEPYTYKVASDGTVSVEEQHLADFLRAIPGSTPASAAAEAAVEDQGAQVVPPTVNDATVADSTGDKAAPARRGGSST
jgi:hypothetical protein